MATPLKSPHLMKNNVNFNSPILCLTPNFQLIASTPSPKNSEVRVIEVIETNNEKGKEKEDAFIKFNYGGKNGKEKVFKC